jgi:hypothetical protein
LDVPVRFDINVVRWRIVIVSQGYENNNLSVFIRGTSLILSPSQRKNDDEKQKCFKVFAQEITGSDPLFAANKYSDFVRAFMREWYDSFCSACDQLAQGNGIYA